MNSAALFSKIYPQQGGGLKQTLLLLHGWGLNHAVWDNVAQALSQHAEVHCIDLPGHGKSPLNLSLNDASRRPKIGHLQHAFVAIAALIATLKQPVTLIGWSLGGFIASHIALQYPQHISKLVLVSATPCFTVRENWPHAMAQKSLTDFAQRLQTNQGATIRSFLCLQMLNLPTAKTVAQTLAKQLAAQGEASAEALKCWLTVLEGFDIRHQISALATMPLLIVQGGRDMLVPVACGDYLSAILPHAKYVRIDAAAHAPFISHESVFLDAVEKFIRND